MNKKTPSSNSAKTSSKTKTKVVSAAKCDIHQVNTRFASDIHKTTQRRPLLQIALDTLSIHEAIQAVKAVEPYVDIVEVGTILLASSGKKAMFILKAAFPDKIIVADMKIADAGSIFSKMAFDSSADLVTVICAADLNTIKSVYKEAQKYPHKPEVQIELTCDFTAKDLADWRKAGATHIVYHRSRDAQAAGKEWGKEDLVKIQELHKAGFKVSITGGLSHKDVKLFKDSSPTIFIAGRTIRGPKAAVEAKAFVHEINKYFCQS
ncbi:3-dehydro-L-gulonate-6-phosphate decarboxylase [Mycoplasmoides fastidiosum]|uniref:3-dehydro-L-gulonate-6-phosphate decarboxylase n=1 Tax=Mycoplasmoides fastidiosum TaxID=92758 RepID=A0ABU0LZI9_9BACT|nr:3-dehydro-L-gulonate-6-phosphate decarboxylase [Mycoplasmoides fastidiosum]MDQ0514098.1 3-dehydro-L-gulonate-6-phosphate decarboxylase [Mycoplasmoides fastidiosum]UUD37493.1 3-dehydro-L-gulonate-6-phosphate decarboxylase [Mycoplasmoides fastidiosum]